VEKTIKMLSIKEIKEKITPIFKDESLKLVLIFGSLIHEKMHKRSDIDIAFLYDGPVDIVGLTNRVIKLLHTDAIDVVDLKKASPLLRFIAVKNGFLIYERAPGMFNEFCSLAFRRYIDTKKLRDLRSKSINQFLEARQLR